LLGCWCLWLLVRRGGLGLLRVVSFFAVVMLVLTVKLPADLDHSQGSSRFLAKQILGPLGKHSRIRRGPTTSKQRNSGHDQTQAK
jgi:hypothetical protein